MTHFFVHIISLKDLTFFIIWCFVDSILFFTITKEFKLSKEVHQEEEERRIIKNSLVLHLQFKQIILSALLVLCINIFIRNSNIDFINIMNGIGFAEMELNTNTTLTILLTLLFIPTFVKITKEFRKNQEEKRKLEEKEERGK